MSLSRSGHLAESGVYMKRWGRRQGGMGMGRMGRDHPAARPAAVTPASFRCRDPADTSDFGGCLPSSILQLAGSGAGREPRSGGER